MFGHHLAGWIDFVTLNWFFLFRNVSSIYAQHIPTHTPRRSCSSSQDQDLDESPHSGRKDSFSECMPLSTSPVPVAEENMRRGSGPLLILSGTEHNLYEHQHHVILSPREQMILSYAQEQYPVGPPPRRHSGTSPPGPVSPSPMRAFPPMSPSRSHASSVTSQPPVMFSSPLAQSPSNSFLITTTSTSPDRPSRPASARLAASQGADPHSRWARAKPRVHAAAAGDLSRSGVCVESCMCCELITHILGCRFDVCIAVGSFPHLGGCAAIITRTSK